jgi:hypothetical protein
MRLILCCAGAKAQNWGLDSVNYPLQAPQGENRGGQKLIEVVDTNVALCGATWPHAASFVSVYTWED